MANNKKDFEYPLPIGFVLKGGLMDYRIEEVLGQGGFGITYRVSAKVTVGHIKSTMMFAIKEHFVKGRCHRAANKVTVEYSEEAAAEVENSLRSFITEGRRLNKICKLNRNIVDVNEVFEANNTAYYVMEYLDGGDLRALVRASGGRLGEAKALAIIRPIAVAVERLHEEKLLHLDIKPENIVMRKGEYGADDEPVLIDFGITKHFDAAGNVTTTNNSISYSEGYSPQEQYGRLTSFSPWVDVYALAATLYYMLVGRDPVPAFDLRPEYLIDTLPSDVSELTHNAIVAGMAKDYMSRTQTVHALLDSLEESVALPASYILHGQACEYRIQGIEQELDCCLVYKATPYFGGGQRGGNITKTEVYTVYEYLVKGGNVKRLPDGRVSGLSLDSESHARFMDMTETKTGLTSPGQSKSMDVSVGCEMFATNNTVYCVVNDRWTNHSSSFEPFYEITEDQKKRIIQIAAVVAAVAVVIGIFWSGALDGLFSSDNKDGGNEASLLDEAIRDNDINALRHYAAMDSSRAFLPLARYYMAEQPDTALLYAERAVAACRSANTDSTEAVKTRDDLLARITPAQRAEVKQSVEKETAKQPAKEEAAKPDKPKETNQPATESKPVITNEQKFNTAVSNKDISALVSLANSGYAPAYSKLASLYLERNNYAMADKYARRALSSGVGRQEAKLVVDILDAYDYYANGEHGGKPN